jgi:hypothetical protein
MEPPPWYSWSPILARGGRGVSVGDSCVGVKFGFGTPFFGLTWPMILPEIFESGKKIDLDLLVLIFK